MTTTTQTQQLAERIAHAIATTPTKTKERNKALGAIKWRLETAEGLQAGLDTAHACALFPPNSPQVMTFDGRDNEQMKQRFYAAALRQPLAIVLCES